MGPHAPGHLVTTSPFNCSPSAKRPRDSLKPYQLLRSQPGKVGHLQVESHLCQTPISSLSCSLKLQSDLKFPQRGRSSYDFVSLKPRPVFLKSQETVRQASLFTLPTCVPPTCLCILFPFASPSVLRSLHCLHIFSLTALAIACSLGGLLPWPPGAPPVSAAPMPFPSGTWEHGRQSTLSMQMWNGMQVSGRAGV